MALLTEARGALTTLIGTEFAADAVILRADRLHTSIGSDGNHYCGISPMGEAESGDNAGLWTGQLIVQMYRGFDPQIDPQQEVDPLTIEIWAERLRVASKNNSSVNTDTCWYFRLTEFTYPPDPTGNMTRFHASVLAFGNNTSMY